MTCCTRTYGCNFDVIKTSNEKTAVFHPYDFIVMIGKGTAGRYKTQRAIQKWHLP